MYPLGSKYSQTSVLVGFRTRQTLYAFRFDEKKVFWDSSHLLAFV